MVQFIQHNSYLLDIARTAIASLLQHKLRSSLSILGIICGVMTVFAIMAIGEGAEVETLNRIEQMGIKNIFVRSEPLTSIQMRQPQNYQSSGLQLDDIERLKIASPDIARVAAIRYVSADIVGMPEGITPQIIEANREYGMTLGLAMSGGRFISELDESNHNSVCVLGWSVSAAMGSKGKAGNMIQVGSRVLKIIGVLQRQDMLEDTKISLQNINDMIIVPFGTNTHLVRVESEPLTELIIEVRSKERVYAVAQLINRALKVAHSGADDFTTIIPLELLNQSNQIKRIFNIVFGTIGGLALIIGGIGIMNIMLANISERIREIGLRRAVGAQPHHIVFQFLMESVILTAVGGVAGALLGVGLSLGISVFAGWPVHFSFEIMLVSLLLAVITGCCFGIYPSIKAARMDPLYALGYTI